MNGAAAERVQLNIQDIHPADEADIGISELFEAEQLYQSRQDIGAVADQMNVVSAKPAA